MIAAIHTDGPVRIMGEPTTTPERTVEDVANGATVSLQAPLPSFSLVLETTNLNMADLGGLRRSLDSIVAQDLDFRQAIDILMVHTGEVSDEMLATLTREYPWLTIISAPAETGYGGAKMVGVQRMHSEVVVFFDSDCVYETGWLRGLLQGLAEHSDIDALGGETMIDPDSVLGFAASLLFSFDCYSHYFGRNEIYEHRRLHLNNAVFRRKALSQCPIPSDLSVLGTSTYLFVKRLQQAGIRVARQPASRSLHAPPNGLCHFFCRFLLFGHDANIVYRIFDKEFGDRRREPGLINLTAKLGLLMRDRTKELFTRAILLLREKPARWSLLPLALPLTLMGAILMVTGYVTTLFYPALIPALLPEDMRKGGGFVHGDGSL